MEKAESWDRKGAISQITQGMELANTLKIQLRTYNSSGQACGFLVEKMVSCYDNALALLNCMDFLENGLKEGSSRSDVSDQDFKDHVVADVSKKRKNLPKWSEEVRVFSGAGSEGQLDDGYNWRKYGQKNILGTTHPRAYYRCTHRFTRGCSATKQVQRGEDYVFKVVYKGKHKCLLKQTKDENVDAESSNDEESQMLSQKMMISIEKELNPENAETRFLLEPMTSDIYFSMSPSLSNDAGIYHPFPISESYVAETISDPISTADFPRGDLDFLTDEVDFDSCFVEAAEYFSTDQGSG